MDLEGRLALVTGGAVRLGRALSEGLAGRGMRVAIHYHRHASEARELMGRLRAGARPAGSVEERSGPELRSADDAAAVYGADFTEAGAAEGLARRVEEEMGPIDALILSASTYPRDPLEVAGAEAVQASLQVNLVAPYLLAREVGLRMKARGGGRIIALLDWSLDRPYPDRIPYTMAKAGLRAAVHGLARALAPQVTVNGIAPGAVLLPEGTDAPTREAIVRATPLGMIGSPEAIVQAAVYLLESDFVTGTIVTVDGGRSVN